MGWAIRGPVHPWAGPSMGWSIRRPAIQEPGHPRAGLPPGRAIHGPSPGWAGPGHPGGGPGYSPSKMGRVQNEQATPGQDVLAGNGQQLPIYIPKHKSTWNVTALYGSYRLLFVLLVLLSNFIMYCIVGNLPSKFGHARSLGSRIIHYVWDYLCDEWRQTDRRTDRQRQRWLLLSRWMGHNNDKRT